MTKPVVRKSYDEIAHETAPKIGMYGLPRVIQPNNGELAALVQAALQKNPRLTSTRIEVRANGSRVWLSGTAIGLGIAAYAADVARAVEGVSMVYNDLMIDSDL